MKIETHKTPENQDCGTQHVQQRATRGPKDAVVEDRKAKQSDKLDISTKSRKLADILSAVNQMPEVREARVAELKKSVENRTYIVDACKVAEKMLKELSILAIGNGT